MKDIFLCNNITNHMPITKQEIQLLFVNNELSHKWETFVPLLKNSISVDVVSVNEKDLSLGQSKIGGYPDLPKTLKWPQWNNEYLSFLAQLNMSEIKHFDTDNILPARGFLYFFYCKDCDIWGLEVKDKGNWRVLYHEETLNLRRIPYPGDEAEFSSFSPCALRFEEKLNLPPISSIFLENVFSPIEIMRYNQLIKDVSNMMLDETKILGYPDAIQSEMEQSCELLYYELNEESIDKNDPGIQQIFKDAVRWKLLMQFTSNDMVDMMWGDEGKLYFFIRDNDLKNKNFLHVWMKLQCY
jgi:uncharacterized protein YwqG